MNTSANIPDDWQPKRPPVRENRAWFWLVVLGSICILGSEFAPEGKGDRANQLGLTLTGAGLASYQIRNKANVEKESNDQ